MKQDLVVVGAALRKVWWVGLALVVGGCGVGDVGEVAAAPVEIVMSELNNRGGLGLKDATPEEIRELQKNRVRRVRPTGLAIERKNQELLAAGQPLLDPLLAAPVGEDAEVVTDGTGTAAAPEPAAESTGAALPAAVDNSTLPAFPPVGNHGNEGSCIGWTITYYNLSHETCLVRGCDNKASAAHRFSPRWTYNMVNGGADNGSSFSQHINIAMRHGVPSLELLPYVAGDYRRWDLNPAHWRAALAFRTNASQSVSGMNTDSGMATAKQLLANGHVLAFGTYITSWVYTSITTGPYAGQRAAVYMSGTAGGHGMTLVGYDDSIWVDINGNGATDSGELGAFKVANSWGAGWANGGFIWVAYDALRTTSAVVNGPTSGRVPLMNNGGNTASYLVPRVTYTPRLVAEFTLNTAVRNQLAVRLGASATTSSTPTTTWYPSMVSNQGGAYAFDGTTTAVDGTFVMDLTELVSSSPSAQNFYLTVTDSAAGSPATLKGYKIIDVSTGVEKVLAEGLPATADGSTRTVALGYSTLDGNSPPTARLTTSLAISGESALVTLDGSGSTDSDGTIASYSWSFGDGSPTETGPQVSHLYTRAGRFTITLAVTDNQGALGTATATVDVPDLTAPTAPGAVVATITKLSKSSRRATTVKVSWTAAKDNVAVASYRVFRDGAQLGTTSTTTLNDTTTAAGRSYVYTVRAVDGAGNVSPESPSFTLVR